MLLKNQTFPLTLSPCPGIARVVKQKEVRERKEKEWPYPPIPLLVKCEFVRQKKLWIEGKSKNDLILIILSTSYNTWKLWDFWH